MTVILENSVGSSHQHHEVLRTVARGDDIENIIGSSNLNEPITSPTGRTLLHVAVIAGNINNVKLLVTKGSKMMLTMEGSDNIIPVLMAAANGKKELTTYLYSKTPLEVFDGTDSKNRILLLSLCIISEIFGKQINITNYV
jgi:ankyrin repeat protein